MVSTCLCAGIADESQLNAILGTWSVATGVTRTIDTAQTYPFVYGHHAQPGSYIVHDPSVGVGIYAGVLLAFGLLDGLSQIADIANDAVGRTLAEADLPKRVRLRRSTEPSDDG